MKLAIVLAACVLSGFAASVAAAGPLPKNALDSDEKAWFYNRPGVVVATATADMAACRVFAEGMTPHTSGAGGSLGIVGSLMDQAMSAGPFAALIDDCMISRGYRRFDVTGEKQKAFQLRFAAMSADAQNALVGGAAPIEGKLARAWVNTMWLPHTSEVSPGPETHDVSPVAAHNWGPEKGTRGVKPGGAVSLRAGDAVFVLNVRYQGPHLPWAMVQFSRRDPQTGARAPISADGKEKAKTPVLEARSGAPERPQTFVMVAPAGTYALEMVSFARGGLHTVSTQFCFGALAVTASPGDVLDLGDFLIDATETVVAATAPAAPFRLRTDPANLDEHRLALSAAPDLAAKLTPAALKDGFHSECLPPIGTIGFPAYGIAVASSAAR